LNPKQKSIEVEVFGRKTYRSERAYLRRKFM
jgi:hypothetical protein